MAKQRQQQKHNPVAKDLRTPKYAPRVVTTKGKKYNRKKKVDYE